MRSEIPLLQNVRVASPCNASWDDMLSIDGDRVRFCELCEKRVYNLSAMGQAEAEGLLRGNEGHLCVRYYRRHDGTILTSDCPVGLRAARQLVLTRTRVSVGLCALLCLAFAGLRSSTAGRTMGSPIPEMAPPTVSTTSASPPTATTGNIEVQPAPVPEQPEMGKLPAVMGEAAAPPRVEPEPPPHVLMGAIAPVRDRER